MCANSEGSGENARMRRTAWAFAGRLRDKYHNLMSWLISWPISTKECRGTLGANPRPPEYQSDAQPIELPDPALGGVTTGGCTSRLTHPPLATPENKGNAA